MAQDTNAQDRFRSFSFPPGDGGGNAPAPSPQNPNGWSGFPRQSLSSLSQAFGPIDDFLSARRTQEANPYSGGNVSHAPQPPAEAIHTEETRSSTTDTASFGAAGVAMEGVPLPDYYNSGPANTNDPLPIPSTGPHVLSYMAPPHFFASTSDATSSHDYFSYQVGTLTDGMSPTGPPLHQLPVDQRPHPPTSQALPQYTGGPLLTPPSPATTSRHESDSRAPTLEDASPNFAIQATDLSDLAPQSPAPPAPANEPEHFDTPFSSQSRAPSTTETPFEDIRGAPQHQRSGSEAYSVGSIDHRNQTISVSAPEPNSANVFTFYGAPSNSSSFTLDELFRVIPVFKLPTGNDVATGPADDTDAARPLSEQTINVSRLLRQGAAHTTIIEFSEFVCRTLDDQSFAADHRALVIEERLREILIEWGKAYLGAVILAACPVSPADIPTTLRPFENSVEVTVLLSIALNFSLSQYSLQAIQSGWRKLFPKAHMEWYDGYVVVPAMSALAEWYTDFFVSVCQFSLSLTGDEHMFPDLGVYSTSSQSELSRAVLELATSGGYLHYFDPDPDISNMSSIDMQTFELKARGMWGRQALHFARRIGPGRAPDEKAAVFLFRHPALCRISMFILDSLVHAGAEVAVEHFVKLRNPFIRYSTVNNPLGVPNWASLTCVSCGLISVALAALEEFPAHMRTGRDIVNSSHLMQVYISKLSCTRKVLIQLSMTLFGRPDVEWISLYNFLKAHLAVNPGRLYTNAPDLYVTWNPRDFTPHALNGFRGQPQFDKDFTTEYQRLKEAQKGDSTISIPFSENLAELYDKAWLLSDERQGERIRQEYMSSLVQVSGHAQNILGPDLANRMAEIIRASRHRAREITEDKNIVEDERSLAPLLTLHLRRIAAEKRKNKSSTRMPVPPVVTGKRPARSLVLKPAPSKRCKPYDRPGPSPLSKVIGGSSAEKPAFIPYHHPDQIGPGTTHEPKFVHWPNTDPPVVASSSTHESGATAGPSMHIWNIREQGNSSMSGSPSAPGF